MIQDVSYSTVRHGTVRAFTGVELVGPPGRYLLRVGLEATGTPTTVRSHGYVVEVREDEAHFWAAAGEAAWRHCGLPYRAMREVDKPAIVAALRRARERNER